jgi:hypothetical protein
MAYIPPQLAVDEAKSQRMQNGIQNMVQGFGQIAEQRQRALALEQQKQQQAYENQLAGEKHKAFMDQADYQKSQRELAPEDRDSYKEAMGIYKLKQAGDMEDFKKKAAYEHGLQKDLLSTKASVDAQAKEAKGPVLSKGEEALDKDYAKKYNTFSGSGAVNSAHSINKLENLAAEMEADQGFGEAGGTRLPLPDFMRSRDAIRRRDETRNAANTTLKELFGGQLSDGERNAAAKEYYNDELDNATNAKILRQKIQQLKAQRAAEVEKAKYFESNRTLKGFKANPDLYNQVGSLPPGITNEHVNAVKGMSDEDLLKFVQGQ